MGNWDLWLIWSCAILVLSLLWYRLFVIAGRMEDEDEEDRCNRR